MKTRCKPGDIAIFIGGLNLGKLVHIDRAFHGEEVINGIRFCKSPTAYVAWVVTSLGGPLISGFLDGEIDTRPRMVSVYDENLLRPLRNPREPDQSLMWKSVPKKRVLAAKPKEVSHG